MLAESVIQPPKNNYKDHLEIGHANSDYPGKPRVYLGGLAGSAVQSQPQTENCRSKAAGG